MTKPDLKPCPFCGSTDVHVRQIDKECSVVSCDGCNAEGGYFGGNDSTSPAEAIEAWNRRTP